MAMNEFKKGDSVLSLSKYSNEYKGVVWKVSDKAVHVLFDTGQFQKFHFNPTHHMQSSIKLLTNLKSNLK